MRRPHTAKDSYAGMIPAGTRSQASLHLTSVDVEVQQTWYDGTADPNLPTNCTLNAWWDAARDFTLDVLANADADVNFADADVVAVFTPPRMGAPNDNVGGCVYNGTVLRSSHPRFNGYTSRDTRWLRVSALGRVAAHQ